MWLALPKLPCCRQHLTGLCGFLGPFFLPRLESLTCGQTHQPRQSQCCAGYLRTLCPGCPAQQLQEFFASPRYRKAYCCQFGVFSEIKPCLQVSSIKVFLVLVSCNL